MPAPIRETLESRSDARCIILSPAEHAPCLVGYDPGHFERLEAELEARHAGDWGPARSATARTLFAMADRFRYDDTGRIILTPIMREMGGIGRQALFLGAGPWFEIWAPERLLEDKGLDPRMARMVQALMTQKAQG